MDTKIDKTTRQLARDYYNGLLSFEEYRDLRRHLIDDITSDDATRPVKSSVPEKPPVALPDKPAVNKPAVAEKRAGTWLLPVVGLAIAGVIIGWLVSSGDGERPVSDDGRAMSRTADTGVPGAAGSPAPVLDEFLAADDWSYDALAGLTLAWSGLRDNEQQAARRSPSFRTLSERLRERVLEQRALRDIDGDAVRREQVLVSLAEHLDITGPEFTSMPPVVAAAAPGQESGKPRAQVQAGTTARRVAEQQAAAMRDEPAEDAVAAAARDAGAPAARPAPGRTTPEVSVAPEQAAGETTPAGKAGGTAPAGHAAAPGNSGTLTLPVKEAEKAPVKETPAVARPAAADACPASLAQTRKPVCSDTLADGSRGPLMVVLPAGSFRMGSEREASEQPVHEVTIPRPFAVSAYEVSVAEYRRFCKASGRHCVFAWQGEKDPAVNVSWKDAQSYTNWLSSVTGMTYRLPTEAEWEYAARGRTTGDYPFGDGTKVLPSDARFNATTPLPVDDRSVNSNGFRLRHVVGNVREWVADAWFENYLSVPNDGRARNSSATLLRAVRGGSFADGAYQLRSSAREGLTADTRDDRTGFRLVREINN